MLKNSLNKWLKIYNNITIPNLLKNDFKPNAINAREGLAKLTSTFSLSIDKGIKTIYDDIILNNDYNIPIRIFVPDQVKKPSVLVYFHGGGHMAGSVTVYDPIYRNLCSKTKNIVIGVEYRLAPENPYPAGLNDALNSLKYIWNVLDERNIKYKKRLIVGGDSGGGALAASAAIYYQSNQIVNIENLFLIYPSLDYTMSFNSINTNGTGYLLEKNKIKWYFDNYFQNSEDRKKASPLFQLNNNKMPETLIFTAEYCPLKDEGIEFVKKLKMSNNKIIHYNLENMIHTFLNMESLCKKECNFVYKTINNFLK